MIKRKGFPILLISSPLNCQEHSKIYTRINQGYKEKWHRKRKKARPQEVRNPRKKS
jgi:hypothetical protein